MVPPEAIRVVLAPPQSLVLLITRQMEGVYGDVGCGTIGTTIAICVGIGNGFCARTCYRGVEVIAADIRPEKLPPIGEPERGT